METIAVYWEESIKTYGIQIETDLCLVRVNIVPGNLDTLGRQLSELGGMEIDFKLILAQNSEPGCLPLYLVFERKWEDTLIDFFTRPAFSGISNDFQIDSPVEMLYFHGPHFGDRYGIANTAFKTIEEGKIQFIAAGCSAASIYFVFPENMAAEAERVLNTIFKAP